MAAEMDVADMLWEGNDAGWEVARLREELAKANLAGAQQAHQIADELRELQPMVQGLYSPDTNQQYEAAQFFRKLLSDNRNPPIENVIEQNVIPQFVKFLQRGDMPQLQFEAAWVLNNVASGTSEHTKVVIDEGAVPKLVQLLASPSDDIREQAVRALGTVAGDSFQCRDVVLNAGALPSLLEQLQQGSKLSILRTATWTLCNFCRGKPPPNFQVIRRALPTLARLIEGNDEDVLYFACWALKYLSKGDTERIDEVIKAGVCRRLVELLLHSSLAVVAPALRTIGNIVKGNELQKQVVLNFGALNSLFTLLTANHNKIISAEACRTISNITAGTKEQIQAVIDACIMPTLLSLQRNALTSPYGESDVEKQALWAISNAISGGTAEQVKHLVDAGAIKALCDVLTNQDVRIVTKALEGLEHILKAGEQMKCLPGSDCANPFAQLVRDADGVNKIEALLDYGSYYEDLHEMAMLVLQTFFEYFEY